MFTKNEYFDGKVASLSHNGAEGKATVGVIAKGEYTFSTNCIEIMTIISGTMDVLLPGETDWKTFGKFDSFVIGKDMKFSVKTGEDTPYLCLYK